MLINIAYYRWFCNVLRCKNASEPTAKLFVGSFHKSCSMENMENRRSLKHGNTRQRGTKNKREPML